MPEQYPIDPLQQPSELDVIPPSDLITLPNIPPQEQGPVIINPTDFGVIAGEVQSRLVVTPHYLRTIGLGTGEESRRFLNSREAQAVFEALQAQGAIAEEPYKDLGFPVLSRSSGGGRTGGPAKTPRAFGREVGKQAGEYWEIKTQDIRNIGHAAVRFARFVGGWTHREKQQAIQAQNTAKAAAHEAWQADRTTDLIMDPDAPPIGTIPQPPQPRQRQERPDRQR